jgi:general secretion pathway protein B
MSFILDALKKSENERQRQVGPSLADVQISRRRSEKPWWAVAVAALLVVNLGVLLVVLTRRDAPAASQSATQTTGATSSAAPAQNEMHEYGGTSIPAGDSPLPAGQARPENSSARSSVRPLAEEADVHEYDGVGVAAAAAMVPEGPPMVRPIEAPSVEPARATTSSPTGAPLQERATAQNEVLPTLTDVTASGTTLPELHLDIHVTSNNPAERFIFVNMRKYTEGQTLSEGPVVEHITADGVILNYHGLRFLLPRQ